MAVRVVPYSTLKTLQHLSNTAPYGHHIDLHTTVLHDARDGHGTHPQSLEVLEILWISKSLLQKSRERIQC